MKTGKENFTSVTWAHAVNCKKLLKAALSSDVEMIEADVGLGKLKGNTIDAEVCIMVHPPEKMSDLALVDFLRQIQAYNEDINKKRKKGIKLDFKSTEVFMNSIAVLDKTVPNINSPIWLNADIIRGPTSEDDNNPVHPTRFFDGCLRYHGTIISIGWTSSKRAVTTEGVYTDSDIDAMLKTLALNNILATDFTLTFPVRASIAARSIPQLTRLISTVGKTNPCTLTIWSAPDDKVLITELLQLIDVIGSHRCYIDVPDDLASQLNLRTAVTEPTKLRYSLIHFGFACFTLYTLSLWLK